MIGWYAHHVGRGHLTRASVVAAELTARGVPVTLLSSGEPAGRHVGDVVRLPRDDDRTGPLGDPTARGALHWAPLGHPGLRDRMVAIAEWVRRAEPAVVVVDVSVEVALLCRLLGVPVVGVVLPGDRGDEPHRLGASVCEALVGCWPYVAAHPVTGFPDTDLRRLRAVGGLGRFGVASAPPQPVRPTVTLLQGAGGGSWAVGAAAVLRTGLAGWDVRSLAGGAGRGEVWATLRSSTVVVTHAGQNALAEVAAARVPAVVVAADRPHDEQTFALRHLRVAGSPVVDAAGGALVEQVRAAADLDGARWSTWVDGRAATRFADVVLEVHDRTPVPAREVS